DRRNRVRPARSDTCGPASDFAIAPTVERWGETLTSRGHTPQRTRSRRTSGWLLVLALLLGAAGAPRAEDCSSYPGALLDGFQGTPAPSQLNIDQNCTIRNYPNGFSTNISFFTQPGQEDQRWLVIFDNVVHTGQMSCNAVLGHKIWFVNGSSS